MLFPWWGTAAYEGASPSASLFGDRVHVLSRLLAGEPLLVVAPLRAFLAPVPDPAYLRGQRLAVERGDGVRPTGIRPAARRDGLPAGAARQHPGRVRGPRRGGRRVRARARPGGARHPGLRRGRRHPVVRPPRPVVDGQRPPHRHPARAGGRVHAGAARDPEGRPPLPGIRRGGGDGAGGRDRRRPRARRRRGVLPAVLPRGALAARVPRAGRHRVPARRRPARGQRRRAAQGAPRAVPAGAGAEAPRADAAAAAAGLRRARRRAVAAGGLHDAAARPAHRRTHVAIPCDDARSFFGNFTFLREEIESAIASAGTRSTSSRSTTCRPSACGTS